MKCQKNTNYTSDLAEIGSLFSKNQCVEYLLCVEDFLSKDAWVTPLKDKNAKTVLNGFIGIVNEYKLKPNKLQVD